MDNAMSAWRNILRGVYLFCNDDCTFPQSKLGICANSRHLPPGLYPLSYRCTFDPFDLRCCLQAGVMSLVPERYCKWTAPLLVDRQGQGHLQYGAHLLTGMTCMQSFLLVSAHGLRSAATARIAIIRMYQVFYQV